jgi:hypothetical protein
MIATTGRDILVTTGNADADAYLAASRAVLRAHHNLDRARAAWADAEAADERHDGFHGTAERRQRAEKRVDDARRALSYAQADMVLTGAPVWRDNPRLGDLVDAEIAEAASTGIARYGAA